MFDLDVLESAIAHIGRTDLKTTTVLGKLYLSKGTISSGSQISAVKTNIEGAQAKLEKIRKDLSEAQKEGRTSKYCLQGLLNKSEATSLKQIMSGNASS